jgi:predicted TPR repeat methyltransferase
VEQLGPPAKDRIMDIGCGAGLFGEVAHRAGWKYSVGIDVNERYASSYQDKPGVQYISSSFEKLDRSKLGGEYDCISLWNVLEHLYNLKSIVAAIHGLLKPGGLLFIMVPNVRSLITRLAREMSPTFNWKHVSHFSPASLKRLMDLSGFECVHQETAITEIDNIKSYMSGEYPYHGYGDPEHLFDFITPEYIHANLLGSRQIGIFRRND